MQPIPPPASFLILLGVLGAGLPAAGRAAVQDPPPQGEPGARPEGGGRRGGPGGGPGGPMMRAERKLVAQFDKDGDKRLNKDERAAARAFLKEEAAKNPAGEGGSGGPGGFGPPRGGDGPRPGGGPGGRGGWGRDSQPGKPGPKIAIADSVAYPEASLFEPSVLRTLFFEFENADWESELAEFHGSDVEVPALLTVDGKAHPGVGVRFRGASSYFMVGAGSKRSLNVSVDFSDPKQRVVGAKTLNLLNGNGDPSFLRAVLYSTIARNYLPAPKVNLVKVVINGESWGLYASAQQFNKDFLEEWYPSAKGVRWKVPGSPRGGGGLAYEGEDLASYERLYEIKSDDKADAKKGWEALIRLCRTLEQTPVEGLEAALAPMLDIDGVLRFLAIENATMNSDGYWIRGSDFSLFLDAKGVFHVIPHDMNECFQAGGGPGGPGGFGGPGGPGAGRGAGFAGGGGQPGGAGGGGPPAGAPGGERGGRGAQGATVDPLAGADDPKKPLLSRLLAVPALRDRYLGYVADVAEKWLDWKVLGPTVASYSKLIEKEVAADTRKLQSTEAFRVAVGLDQPAPSPAAEGNEPPRRPAMSLQQFVEQRRKFLLEHPEIVKLRTAAGGKH